MPTTDKLCISNRTELIQNQSVKWLIFLFAKKLYALSVCIASKSPTSFNRMLKELVQKRLGIINLKSFCVLEN